MFWTLRSGLRRDNFVPAEKSLESKGGKNVFQRCRPKRKADQPIHQEAKRFKLYPQPTPAALPPPKTPPPKKIPRLRPFVSRKPNVLKDCPVSVTVHKLGELVLDAEFADFRAFFVDEPLLVSYCQHIKSDSLRRFDSSLKALSQAEQSQAEQTREAEAHAEFSRTANVQVEGEFSAVLSASLANVNAQFEVRELGNYITR